MRAPCWVRRGRRVTGVCNRHGTVWMQLCFTANDLLGWAQRIGCTGQLRRATPKTIRHRLLHIAAAITPNGRRLHLDRVWPWTTTLLDAINRIPNTHRDPPTPQAAL